MSLSAHPLTERQKRIFEFIKGSIRDRGYPPSLREIGAHMGIKSTNGVNDHLTALERKGYLRRDAMKSRALQPVEPVDESRAALERRIAELETELSRTRAELGALDAH